MTRKIISKIEKNQTNKQTNNHDLIFNIGFFKMRNIFRIERSNIKLRKVATKYLLTIIIVTRRPAVIILLIIIRLIVVYSWRVGLKIR